MSFFLLLSYLTTALSHLALMAVLLRILLSFPSLVFLLSRFWRWTGHCTQLHQYFIIPKFDQFSQLNPLYGKAVSYISSLSSAEQADHGLVFSSSTRTNFFTFQLAPGQTADDSFNGARITWIRPSEGAERLEIRMRRQDRTRILRPYLHYIETEAAKAERRQRELQLFEQPGETLWVPLPLTHPCDMGGFKVLARSYLGLSEHPLFEEIWGELLRGARLSLAEVAGLIVENRRSPQRAMRRVLNALQEARGNGAEAEREAERERREEQAERRGRLERVKRIVRKVRRVLHIERRRE